MKRRGNVMIRAQVTYRKPASAAAAAETLDGSELDGSKLDVKQHVPKRFLQGEQKGGSGTQPNDDATENDGNGNDEAHHDDQHDENNAGAGDGESSAADGGNATSGATLKAKRSKPGAPRRPKSKPAKGEPSETVLYVSHLAYSVNNDKLMELFAPYNVKSAQVVYNRFRPRQSRGFAFVDFHSKQDQEKAMAEKNGTELMGRTLNVTSTSVSYTHLTLPTKA